jgi:hypothetical protein
MNAPLPPIYFYIPQSDWLEGMPTTADVQWVGFRRGIFCWTLQTYLRLKADGFPCELVGTLPEEGIILAHWDSLPSDLKPNAKQLIVCFQADRARHPYAQVHIVQNSQGLLPQLMLLGDRYLLPGKNAFMPLWAQPGLIPRDPTRGDRFETVAFFGLAENLAPELRDPDWAKKLSEMGLQWHLVSEFDRWSDYSQVDAIVAVRTFTRQSYTWKPATKLYNAWHAGVPAILGYDSAFRAERQSDLDYLEVFSPKDVIAALRRLRDEPAFRQAMIENGQLRAQETTPVAMTARWRSLLMNVVVPAYQDWCKASGVVRQSFLMRREGAIQSREFRKGLQKLRNSMGVRSRLRSLLPTQLAKKPHLERS